MVELGGHAVEDFCKGGEEVIDGLIVGSGEFGEEFMYFF